MITTQPPTLHDLARTCLLIAWLLSPLVGLANLLPNPSFETQGSNAERAQFWDWGMPDTNGFVYGSAARVNWRSYPPGSGTWSAAIRGTWAGLGNYGGWARSVPVVPGARYRLSGWFWADDGNPFGPWTASSQMLGMFFHADDQLWIDQAVTSLAGVGQTWVQRSVEAVAPENATSAQVYFFADGVGGAGAIVGDGFTLELMQDLYSTLIAHYPLNHSATDAGGFLIHGALSGTFPEEDRFGREAHALGFQSGDSAVTPFRAPLANDGSMTISFWLKTSSSNQALVSLVSSEGDFLDLGLTPEGHVRVSGRYSYDEVSGHQPLHDGAWHHVAWAGELYGQSRVYVDGQAYTSGWSLISLPGRVSLRLGGDHDGQINFSGALDDVRVFRSVLSPGEVRELWRESPPTNLVTGLALEGNINPPEGSAIGYGGRAFFSDGTSRDVTTESEWSLVGDIPNQVTQSRNILFAGLLDGPTSVTLNVTYTLGSFTTSATRHVTFQLPDSDGDGLRDAYEKGYGRYEVIGWTGTWDSAAAEVATDGDSLATIQSFDEFLAVSSILDTQLLFRNTWIGLDDSEAEAVWRWINGEPFFYSRWSTGFMNSASRDYAYIAGDETAGGDSRLFWLAAPAISDTPISAYLLERGWYTNPDQPDTDGDGYSDGMEVAAGHSPVNFYDHPAGTRYVVPFNPNARAPYTNWQSAATSVFDAHEMAVAGDVVLVSNGTYQVDWTLSLIRAVTLKGVNGAEQTILNGDGSGWVVTMNHPESRVENFHIRGGRALDGGGVYLQAGTLRNCVISSNRAELSGGGVYAFGGLVESCTITDNESDDQAGGLYGGAGAQILNTIVYGNRAPVGSNVWGEARYDYSCVAPLPAEGTGNISDDPRFVNAATRNFRLQPDSPCREAGEPGAWMAGGKDAANFPRIIDVNPEIGAFEFSDRIITTRVNGAGSISPSGDVLVAWGNSRSFLIAADPFYYIHRILVDGLPLPLGGHAGSANYTFTNVMAHHDLTVEFLTNNLAGAISFDATDSRVSETNGPAVILVRRDTTNGSASVAYATQDGTAVAGSDYVAVTGRVFFAPGEEIAEILVPLLVDSIFEDEEYFEVWLSDPQGDAILTTPSVTRVYIDWDWATLPPRRHDQPDFAYTPSAPDWRDVSIYQIFTDRFDDGDPANNTANPEGWYNPSASTAIHGGDFNGIRRRLDYIQMLGARAIWISPVAFNVRSEYHAYAIEDFNRIDPVRGTLEELRALIDDAHARGIYVFIDVVLNHMGDRVGSSDSGFPAFKLSGYNLRWWDNNKKHAPPFDDLSKFHPYGQINNWGDPVQSLLGDFYSLDDLKSEDPRVRRAMARIYQGLISATDCDGFRVDTARHMEMEFWEEVLPQIYDHAATLGKSNFITFAEAWLGNDSAVAAFTGTNRFNSALHFPLRDTMQSVFEGEGLLSWLTTRLAGTAVYAENARDQLVSFIDNHDMARALASGRFNGSWSRLEANLAFLYTTKNVPCLYYGTEQGFSGWNDPNNREDMFAGQFEPSAASVGDNFNQTHRLYQTVRRLNLLRAAYPALPRGAFTAVKDDDSLYAYTKKLDAETLLVVINPRTFTAAEIIPTPFTNNTVLVNATNLAERYTIGTNNISGSMQISLGSGQHRIFVPSDRVAPLPPTITRALPNHAQITNRLAPIQITFDKPMLTGSVMSAFTIAPPMAGTYYWSNSNQRMTFVPSTPWDLSATYTVRVAAAATATNGLTLGAGFQTFFNTLDRLSLTVAQIDVVESPTQVVAWIARDSAGDSEYSVTVRTRALTAGAGEDFIARTSVVTLASGQMSNSFVVTILDDALVEPPETFQIALSNPQGGAILGAITSAVVTILADDGIFMTEHLDQDPGWVREGPWAFGRPLGESGDPTSGFTGTNVFGYNLAGAYSNNISTPLYLTAGPFDTRGFREVRLLYRRWLGVENSRWDRATIEVSADALAWSVVWSNDYSISLTDTRWIAHDLALGTEATHQSNVWIRWGMGLTDSIISYGGWNIDDVILYGVTNLVPVPSILRPEIFAEFIAGESLELAGSAVDPDDVFPPVLAWSSDIAGELGAGSNLAVQMLSPGSHEIRLTAWDSFGAEAIATRAVLVWSDANTNGLPDDWEISHWPGGHSGGADGDDDSDGMSNYEEWLTGTDPTNPASYFAANISGMPPPVMVSWSARSNRWYQLESAHEVLGVFVPVGSEIRSPADGPVSVIMTGIPPSEVGGFRLRARK